MAIKNIEMQKKNADGSFDIFHPKTKASMVIAEDGSNLESHLADNTNIKHKAKEIGLEDMTNKFTATNVETGMLELFTNVSNGKDLVSGAITGVDDTVVIPTNPTFNDLASGINGISTGRKWASGTTRSSSNPNTPFNYYYGDTVRTSYIEIVGLDFIPSKIMVYSNSGTVGCSVDTDAPKYLGYTSIVLSGITTIRLDGNAYIRLGDIKLPFGSGDMDCYWIAIK